jgi:predicted PurR-regulated permease PerM
MSSPIAETGDSSQHQPEAGEPVLAAEVVAAEISTPQQPMGRPGRPFNRRSPFFIGMAGAAGVAVTYYLIQLLLAARPMLILIGLAVFLAVGLEPAVSLLVRHRLRRGFAVIIVVVLILGIVAGFLAAAIPALVTQGTGIVKNIPTWVQQANDHHSLLGRLNDQFKIVDKIQSVLNSSSQSIAGGVVGAGVVVFSAVTDTLIVLVLTLYFLADMPRIRRLVYRLFPESRRPRAILIGDDIASKVGGYVLGNLVVSLVAGLLTFGWLLAFGVPYAFLLSIMVALLDLVPVIGSTVAGIVVALVALTVSLPVCLATVGFFIVYRLLEDYLLVPRIIGRAVEVPALVTVVSVLIGGALLGIIGALVAIPAAAAVQLLVREILLPRQDQA